MAERVVVRRKKTKPDLSNLPNLFRHWALQKEAEANAKVVKERLRTNDLFPAIEASGIEDDKGSLILNFDQPIPITSINADGVKKQDTYVGLKKERRVSEVFQEDVAAAWLKTNRLLSKVEVTVQTITKRPGEPVEQEEVTFLDQNKIYVLNQEGKVPDEVLDSFFEERVTWALVPLKA